VDLGLVTDLMATGPTSVLVMEYTETVEGEAKTLERLVPFVNAYVDEVNTAERRITVDWQPDY
jgi:16S rRNA processing protein RimM